MNSNTDTQQERWTTSKECITQFSEYKERNACQNGFDKDFNCECQYQSFPALATACLIARTMSQ